MRKMEIILLCHEFPACWLWICLRYYKHRVFETDYVMFHHWVKSIASFIWFFAVLKTWEEPVLDHLNTQDFDGMNIRGVY